MPNSSRPTFPSLHFGLDALSVRKNVGSSPPLVTSASVTVGLGNTPLQNGALRHRLKQPAQKQKLEMTEVGLEPTPLRMTLSLLNYVTGRDNTAISPSRQRGAQVHIEKCGAG